MSRKRIIIAVAGVLLAAGAVAAISAPGHRGGGWFGGPGPMMHGGDEEEGRGMRGRFGRSLTKEEHEARARERFARLDKNSDGVIDTTEIDAALAERQGWFRRHRGADMAPGARALGHFDANRDGKVTREEARAEVERRFAEMDLNNDGRIDDQDLPPMLRGRNVIAEGGPGMGAGPGRRGGIGGLGLLRQADTNKDGVVTRDEAAALADREHARFDRNKDGTVDQADFDALQKEMRDYRVKRFVHHHGADKDGRITREQFQAKAAERFARMDLNNDGSVSRDELPGRGFGMHRWGGERGQHWHGGPGMPGHGMGPGTGGPGEGPGPAPGGGPAPRN